MPFSCHLYNRYHYVLSCLGVYNIECLPQNLLINTSESPGTQEPSKSKNIFVDNKYVLKCAA